MLVNPIVMLQFMGEVIRYLGLGGYNMFKTKYIESHYRQSSSNASIISGTTTIIPIAVGLVLGGGVMSWFKPRPLYVLIYLFVVELVLNFSIISGIFLGCPAPALHQTWNNNECEMFDQVSS